MPLLKYTTMFTKYTTKFTKYSTMLAKYTTVFTKYTTMFTKYTTVFPRCISYKQKRWNSVCCYVLYRRHKRQQKL